MDWRFVLNHGGGVYNEYNCPHPRSGPYLAEPAAASEYHDWRHIHSLTRDIGSRTSEPGPSTNHKYKPVIEITADSPDRESSCVSIKAVEKPVASDEAQRKQVYSIIDRLMAYTIYWHQFVPIFTYAGLCKIIQNIQKSYHVLYPHPYRVLLSCSLAAFALILVGYIAHLS